MKTQSRIVFPSTGTILLAGLVAFMIGAAAARTVRAAEKATAVAEEAEIVAEECMDTLRECVTELKVRPFATVEDMRQLQFELVECRRDLDEIQP